MRVSILIGAALLCLPAYARKPITHEDLWQMRRVEAPALSPDGKWIVVAVTEPAYDTSKQSGDLWLLATSGSAQPRKLTQTRSPESSPSWSPDSTRVAFSAKREGDTAAQIYVIDVVHGGEAQRITSVDTGANAPVWSPDGRLLAFQSNVRAEPESPPKYNVRVYDYFPVRYWDKWLDDSRRHLFTVKAEPGAKSLDVLAGTKLAEGPGFAGSSTTSGQDLQPVWAPDGRSILFTATETLHLAAGAPTSYGIYRVPVEGGEPQRLTAPKTTFRKATFTRDGKSFFALEEDPEKIYALERLVRFSWPEPGKPVPVAPGWDRSVTSYVLSPDGRTIYITSEDGGREQLFQVPAAGGTPTMPVRLVQGCFTNLASATSAGAVLAANYDSATEPPEVAVIDGATGQWRKLSRFNIERAADLDLPPLREFTFTSKRGRPIHNFVVLPPAFDENKRYPLFSVLHGGPHSMWRDQWVTRWNYHLLAQPGYVVLLTNYTGSSGFGEKFAQAIQNDPLAGPAEEINQAVDEAISRFPFVDPGRLAAGGASYGGHLANWLQASTTRYRCLLSHAGLIDLESQWGTSDVIYHRELGMGGPYWAGSKVWQEQNPIRYADRFRTPMLVTVGEKDYRVPINQSLENWAILQRMQVPSRLLVFPDENHWILNGENSRFWYSEVHAWLKKWLDPAQPQTTRALN